MWIPSNPNPKGKQVPDCVIRAISIALKRSWYDIYDDLCELGRRECNVPSADSVWGLYLQLLGAEAFLLPDSCPRCTTVSEFAKRYPRGTYIIGTGGHAVAVIDGDYYDSWNSGEEIPTFFWRIE